MGGPASGTRLASLAGRRRELDVVLDVLDGGSPGAVLIVGEAGIGKTRLVSAAVGSRPDLLVASGICLPLTQSPPLLPFGQAMRTLLTTSPAGAPDLGWLPDWVRVELTRLVPLLLPPLSPPLGPPIGPPIGAEEAGVSDGASDRHRMFEAVRIVLEHEGRSRPVVMVIEDLHWADEATLDLLLYLAASGEPSPLPIVVTSRDDLPADAEQVVTRLTLAGAVARVDLVELTEAETAEQVRDTLGATQSPDVVRDIHRRSGGNPLFVDQLLSHISTTGSRLSGAVPPGLRSLLQVRLDALGDNEIRVLRGLAIVERPLRTAALAEICGEERDEVEDTIEALVRARLVRRTSDASTVELRHALIGEVVRLGPVPSGELRRLHESAASVLAREGTASAAEIADHHAAARQPEAELPWRLRAGDHATAVHAALSAADQYGRAVALWADLGWAPRLDLGLEPWQLYERAFTAADDGGDGARAGELAEEAYQRFSGGADPRLLAWLEVHRGHFQRRAAGRGPVPSLDTALWLAQTHELAEMEMRVHQELAGLYLSRGDFVLAHEHVTAALASPRAPERPDVQQRLRALDLWLIAALGERSGPVLRSAVAETAEVGGLPVAAAAEVRGRLGDLLLDLGDLRGAATLQRRALAQAQQHGLASGYWADVARYNLAEALLEGGDTPAADEVVAQGRREQRLPASVPTALLRAAVDLRAGRFADAEASWAGETVPDAHTALRREFCLHRLDHGVWTGDPERALADTLEVLEETCATDQGQFVGGLLSLAMRAVVDGLVHPGDDERVRRGQDALRRLLTVRTASRRNPFESAVIPVTARAHGLTWTAEQERLGDPDHALQAWRAASAEWAGLGRPHRVGYCLLRQGEAQVVVGTPHRETTRTVREAAVSARGHQPLLDAVVALARLARVPLDVDPAEQRGPGGVHGLLTSRELAVLTLVAQGRTNAEIGLALHISPKTAGVHVGNILHKLGVRSRAQAAAVAGRLGLP